MRNQEFYLERQQKWAQNMLEVTSKLQNKYHVMEIRHYSLDRYKQILEKGPRNSEELDIVNNHRQFNFLLTYTLRFGMSEINKEIRLEKNDFHAVHSILRGAVTEKPVVFDKRAYERFFDGYYESNEKKLAPLIKSKVIDFLAQLGLFFDDVGTEYVSGIDDTKSQKLHVCLHVAFANYHNVSKFEKILNQ